MGYELFTTNVDPGKHAGGVEREKRSFKTLESFFPRSTSARRVESIDTRGA